MGFGSYDESEQEQDTENEEDTGEDMTGEIKGKDSDYKGESTVENSVDEMLELL